MEDLKIFTFTFRLDNVLIVSVNYEFNNDKLI